jgi:hypothetical protein
LNVQSIANLVGINRTSLPHLFQEAYGQTPSTLNVNSGGVLTLGALKYEDGDTGTSALNIENATVTLNQIVAGKKGPLTTTIGDGGTLTVGVPAWGSFRMDDLGSSIIIEGSGTFKRWTQIDITNDTNDPLARIVDINDVTIIGVSGEGADAAYTIYTVPEPATMSVLAIGGLGVLLKRRRPKNK